MSINKTILIVEDEAPLINAMDNRLSKEGFTVIQARDGQEGLQIALNNHPDLIISDIVMPNMDGFSMVSRIRQDEWGKNVPIILLTNLNEAKDVAAAVELEIFDFLVKSNWKLKDLVSKVREKLNLPPAEESPMNDQPTNPENVTPESPAQPIVTGF